MLPCIMLARLRSGLQPKEGVSMEIYDSYFFFP
jgi:hypothetical protein